METEIVCVAVCIFDTSKYFTVGEAYSVYLADDDYFAIDNNGVMRSCFRSTYNHDRFLTNNGLSAFVEV